MHHNSAIQSIWPFFCLTFIICGSSLVFLTIHRLRGSNFVAEPSQVVHQEECGYSPYTPPSSNYKVINGHKVDDASALPWMATLFYGPFAYCSASLISSQFVLTAAHCLVSFYHHEQIGNDTGPWDPVETDAFSLSFGVVDYLQNRSGQVLRSKKIFPHFAYTQEDPFIVSNSYEDIAVIQLERSVKISSSVHPICLSAKSVFVRGETALVAGWGMSTRNNYTTLLHDGWTTIEDNRYCLRKRTDFLSQKAFCCSSVQEICHGDSGGPLAQKLDASHWYQIGVTSGLFGDGVCHSPEVFMRIAPNCKWIEEITKDVKCI